MTARAKTVLTMIAALLVGGGMLRLLTDPRTVEVALPEPPAPNRAVPAPVLAAEAKLVGK